jgi:hypothetical protein
MNEPLVVSADTFQEAWLTVLTDLQHNGWILWNVMVHIKQPLRYDKDIHSRVKQFCKDNNLLVPIDVAYTIFPHGFYKGRGFAERLYSIYNDRFYPWTRKRPHSGWGTYFHRMIAYSKGTERLNQLDNIIRAINTRDRNSHAAFTIIIEEPGGETIRARGGPCLNYIAIQVESGSPRIISMLGVYRNHDFLERAYGNYWGLANLLGFLASETASEIGTLTCVSSHAYVDKKKTQFRAFIEELR